MSAVPTFPHADWEELVAEHQEAIRLVNELEYQVYRLGEVPPHPRLAEARQAAGALIGLLRRLLFRHDQQVLPVLEALSSADAALQGSTDALVNLGGVGALGPRRGLSLDAETRQSTRPGVAADQDHLEGHGAFEGEVPRG
jgi:hypothetical protein